MGKRKSFIGVLLAVVMILCAMCFVACGQGNDSGGVEGTYYLYENEQLDKSSFIKLDGGKWTDDDNESGAYTISGNSITIYVEMGGEKEEFAKGTLKDGVLTLTIMGGKVVYCQEGKTPSGETKPSEPVQQNGAIITNIVGATMDETSVFMLVDETTESVSLSSRVTCSEGSVWKLYYDKLGQVEIPTKIAAGQSGALNNGDNIFYIVVTSGDATKMNVYEIKIHRQYEISVNYYDGATLLDTEEMMSGNTFNASYIPTIAGYTFNYWKNSKNQKYSEGVLYESLSLYADKTANKYTVNLDVNGGNELSESSAQVTYDDSFKFDVPTRAGYTFSGWYVRYNQSKEEKLTNEKGSGLSVWNRSEDITVKAGWTANDYDVTLKVSDTNAGTVSGGGTYKYDGNVKITSQTQNGYVWLGWYDKNNELVSNKSSYNFTMGFDVTYTAKWSKIEATQNISGAGVVTSLNDKYVLGQELKITATSYLGYDFIGWYCNDVLVADSCEYTFTTSANNETYVATWKIKDELKNLKFSSDLKVCKIEGVEDKTIAEVVIPDYVTSIGNYAFQECSGLTKVIIGNGVTSIGNYAFDGCTGLTSVIIGNGVTSIGKVAFYNCSGLTSVTIGNSVTSIGQYAFYGCSGLTSVTIPDSVTSIGNGAFAGCSSLESITLPFIGAKLNGTENTHFGYIFGASSYSYNGNYVPSSLKTVIISNNSGVTSIGQYAFYGCSGLTSVTIPDSVTSIGSYAFYGFSSLWSVTIGNSVTSIGEYAFYGCYKLVEVINNSSLNITKGSSNNGYVAYYAPNVKNGGSSDIVNQDGYLFYTSDGKNYLFGYVGNATDLKLPVTYNGNNYEIYNYAFSGCSGLTSITIPDSVTSIGNSAFYNCSKLTSITIPDSVTSIGENAFRGCSSLESITLPFIGATLNGTENTHFGYIFGASSYSDNGDYVPSSLKTVIISNSSGVTSIGGSAFAYCSGLTSITIPDSVTSIGSYAFSGCSGLTSVTIPDSVTSIGSYAFSGCSGLTSVTIGNSVTSIGQYAFHGCSGLTSITIPNSVTSIGNSAFYNCSKLTSVTIPDSVTSIGNGAFAGCSSLESITLPFIGATLNGTENTHFGYIFGARYYYKNSDYVPSSLKTVVISSYSGVTSIGNYAFYYCSSLTSVAIPNSVTSIRQYAFYGCTGLTSVTIPDSVTSIGESAFNGCSGLTSVTIPDSVTSIGSYAFSGCSGLTSVTIPDSVTSIGSYAFSGCSSLESITLPFIGAKLNGTENTHFGYIFGASSYSDNGEYVPSSLKTVVISSHSGVTSIGESAFAYCTELTSVTIPNSVTSIGSYAFGGCSGLQYNEYDNALYLGNDNNPYVALIKAKSTNITSCIINEKCRIILDHAFSGCSGLTSVTIPDSVTSIGDYTFSGCSSLESITLPFIGAKLNGTENTHFGYIFGASSYSYNSTYVPSSLKTVIISNSSGVTSIGGSAFAYCRSLTSITIPNSVTSIGSYAFNYCTGLTEIHYNGTIAQWEAIKKDSGWAKNVPSSCKVICTDGETSL